MRPRLVLMGVQWSVLLRHLRLRLVNVTVNNADDVTIHPLSSCLSLFIPSPLAVPCPSCPMHDVCVDSGPTVKHWGYTSTTNTSCCWVNSRLVHCWHAPWAHRRKQRADVRSRKKGKEKHVTGKALLAPNGWNWIQWVSHWLNVMSLDGRHRLPPIWAN